MSWHAGLIDIEGKSINHNRQGISLILRYHKRKGAADAVPVSVAKDAGARKCPRESCGVSMRSDSKENRTGVSFGKRTRE